MKTHKPIRRALNHARSKARKTVLTIGDLIAAAFDTLHDEQKVERVLSSREMTKQIHRRIVVIGA